MYCTFARVVLVFAALCFSAQATIVCPESGCMQFDGTSTLRKDVLWRDNMGNFSISVWARALESGTHRIFDIELENGVLLRSPLGNATLVAAQWQHVVWQVTASSYHVYVDAAAQTVTSSAVLSMVTIWHQMQEAPPVQLHIATSFVGYLDTLVGWHRLLNAVELSALVAKRELCLDCARNMRSGEGQAACTCEANADTNLAAYSDMLCECAPGYQQVGDVCERCPEGFYCPWAIEMHPCREGSSTGPGATSSYDCVCDAGRYMLLEECTVCPENQYCVEGQAFSCDGGTVSLANSASPDDCVCPEGTGFELDDTVEVVAGKCIACAAGTYSNSLDRLECNPCPGFEYSEEGASTCDLCVAGYYGAAHECAECPLGAFCPLGSVSPQLCPVGSVGLKPAAVSEVDGCGCLSGIGVYPDCKCTEGQVASHCSCIEGTVEIDGVCVACPAGSWCPGGKLAHECELALQTSAPLSTSASDCVCSEGYSLLDGACVACAQHTYKDFIGDGACLPCPAHTATSTEGTTTVMECVCNDGYFAPTVPYLCYECGFGFYCSDSTQHSCPIYTSTLQPNSSAAEACLCLPGFYLHMGNCVPCAQASFKSELSNDACELCTQNTYNPLEAQVSRDACIDCPFGTIYTDSGATDVSFCEECPSGYYEVFSDLDGYSVCEVCGVHMATPRFSTSISNCTCAAGYEMDSGVCVACGIGTFKHAMGDGPCTLCEPGTYAATHGQTECTACPHGTYLADTGAVSVVNCTACLENSWHPLLGEQDDTNCKCNAGYYGDAGGECFACDDAHYCPGAGQRFACQENTISTGLRVSLDDCVCVAGYWLWESTCVPCPPNFFKETAANAECSACPHDMFTIGAVTSSIDACVCPSGKRKGEAGSCELCDIGYFNPVYGGECQECPANSTTQTAGAQSAADCHCVAGFWESAPGVCEPCPSGSFCPQGDQKNACPRGMTSAVGTATVAECVCIGGLYLWESGCETCTQDHYCPEGSNEAVACPNGTGTIPGQSSYSSVDSCVCLGGSYGTGGATPNCTTCSSGKTSITGAQTAHGCVCAAGYGDDGSGGCELCVPDTYWDSGCVACPAGKTSAGGTAPCICADGTYTLANGQCAPCPEDFFCQDGEISGQCTDPVSQVPESPSSGSCQCRPGYYNANCSDCAVDEAFLTCVLCPVSSYCPGGNISLVCPYEHSITLDEGATSVSMCVCGAGYTLVDAVCEPCPTTSYKDSVGNEACTPCDGGRVTSATGSTSSTACTCAAGDFSFTGSADYWINENRTHAFASDGPLQNWVAESGAVIYDSATSAVELVAVRDEDAVFVRDFYF